MYYLYIYIYIYIYIGYCNSARELAGSAPNGGAGHTWLSEATKTGP